MKRSLCIAAIVFSGLFAVSAAAAQTQAGRYDQQIYSNVARITAGSGEYKNVTAQVEDGVVTLRGSVEFDSQRRELVSQVRRVAHVDAVVNEIVLAPPAPPDHILQGMIVRRLADAGFAQIRVEVHEGSVTLSGSVHDQHDWNWVRTIVSLTPGVKEVQTSRLQIIEPWAF